MERRLDEAQYYFPFADRFGWRSAEVDAEPAWLIEAYHMIFDADVEAAELQAARRRASERARQHLRG